MALSDEIDTTVPADNVKADKSAFRGNFTAIADAVDTLEQRTSLPWLIAIGTLKVTE